MVAVHRYLPVPKDFARQRDAGVNESASGEELRCRILIQSDDASIFEPAIEGSQRPLKLIEAKLVEPHPASELKGPMARLRRRI
jgi:hypothetical protein